MSSKVIKENAVADNEVRNDTIYLPSSDDRIAELAYYKAESRGFEPGFETEDWLAAEREFYSEASIIYE
jgi:hypothetical protein